MQTQFVPGPLIHRTPLLCCWFLALATTCSSCARSFRSTACWMRRHSNSSSRALATAFLKPASASSSQRSLSRSAPFPPAITSTYHRRAPAAIMQAAAASSSSASSSGEGMRDIGGGGGERITGGAEAEDRPQSWRERIAVSIAKSRRIRGGNYVQLATVDPETNEPRCRTVVFRGFQKLSDGEDSVDSSCTMKMITDARSNKVREIASAASSGGGDGGGATAELVWWFGKSSEQYRVRGVVQYVGDSYEEFPLGSSLVAAAAGNGGDRRRAAVEEFLARARREQWGNLSDAAREQFFWNDPGGSYTQQAAVIPPGGRDGDGKILPPPKEFLLLLLLPHTVDYLRLTDNYHQVDELQTDAGGVASSWIQNRVNP